MATLPLTPSQLQMQVAQIRQRDPEAQVIGIRTTGSGKVQRPWTSMTVLYSGAGQYCARSTRGLTDGRGAPGTDRPLDQARTDRVGYDVVARLARSRLFHLDVWESVRALFKARWIDPTLRAPCVAQTLLSMHLPLATCQCKRVCSTLVPPGGPSSTMALAWPSVSQIWRVSPLGGRKLGC